MIEGLKAVWSHPRQSTARPMPSSRIRCSPSWRRRASSDDARRWSHMPGLTGADRLGATDYK